ncbi:hypothetical protein QLX08_010845 [Tetragonisca angustula]|uniref:Ribosomal biogenesis protein LAS1L n=1 Tax=Tetragonisca angustula TaxID=166442 RepID=A0AAW0ZAB6_9HYME
MALSMRHEGIKQVPWFSLAEWHQVYKQVYSNDVNEQNKGYEMLLVWQARIPKLPVGVDCTLSIMQVCARDREWTPKINNGELPISYENDLCLMYSTTIMRLLNHISNVGHTKQTSLFQIAKQLNIPEWIVNLRHDTAHGHELPSIGVLRIAINLLLVWLHEQYWAVEAKRMEEYLINEESVKEVQETEEVQDFDDLIELWTSVSLYIHAGYHLVSNVPDLQLKETLQDLRSYAISLLKENSEDMENDIDNYIETANDDIKKDKKYTLETARIVLLSEISRFLNKKSIPGKKDIVCNTLLSSEVFLPSKNMLAIFSKNTENESEKDVLPLDMVEFWKDIIFLLCEKNFMEVLIVKLLELINNNKVNEEKKLLASLWISSISYSFLKLDIAHSICRTLEYHLEKMQKKLPPKAFELKVKEKLILNISEFSLKFIVPILELLSSKIDNKSKQLLLNLMNVSIMVPLDKNDINSIECEKIFTLSDLEDNKYLVDTNKVEDKILHFLADKKIRNNYWNFAVATHNWAESPIGLLPWQNDALEFVSPLNMVVQKYDVSVLDSEILPGIIDMKNVKIHGRINWNNVLRKKKRLKRKQDRRNINIIMNKALETVKKQK